MGATCGPKLRPGDRNVVRRNTSDDHCKSAGGTCGPTLGPQDGNVVPRNALDARHAYIIGDIIDLDLVSLDKLFPALDFPLSPAFARPTASSTSSDTHLPSTVLAGPSDTSSRTQYSGDIVKSFSYRIPSARVNPLHLEYLNSTESRLNNLAHPKMDPRPPEKIDLEDLKADFTLRTPFDWTEGLGKVLIELPDQCFSALERLGDVTLALGLDIFPRNLSIESTDVRYFTGNSLNYFQH